MAKILESNELVTQLTPISMKNVAKAKPIAKEFSLKPYRQGAFDGFCGVYSIINAMRLISTTADGLGEEFCDRLFNALIRHATLRVGIRRLAKNGTPQWLMRSFIRGSCAYVGRHRKLKPVLRRPMLGKGRLTLAEVIRILRKELAERRCSFIVEIGGVHIVWN